MRTSWWKCVAALALALADARAEAQGPSGRLAGRVVDSTGAPLPGVAVEARGSAVGLVGTAQTDAAGEYRIDTLAAGTWEVWFQLPNFAASVVRGVVVTPGQEARADATLKLRLASHVVVLGTATFRDLSTVGADAELVGIASTASSGVVAGSRLAGRPVARPGDLAESVPGVIISQHSGEGKANQYYVRGFNIDHGTDLALSVAGLPVNLPTNGHGQGYADLNFVIPELVAAIQYEKGTYAADEGDFSAAGAIHMNYLTVLDRPIARVEAGGFGYRRALFAASPRVGAGHLLGAIEISANDGPWLAPDDFRKVNAVLRYSEGTAQSGFSVSGLFYDANWNSTDQVPRRAIADGSLSRSARSTRRTAVSRDGWPCWRPGSGATRTRSPGSRATPPATT